MGPPKRVATHILRTDALSKVRDYLIIHGWASGALGSASQTKLLLESLGELYKYTGRWQRHKPGGELLKMVKGSQR